MAIFTEKLCFNHMPKTAGRWIVSTMIHAGIRCEFRGGGAHNCVEPHQLEGRRPFACVRHPFVWLASFHAHRRKKGKWFALHLDALYHEDWHQFLYNVVREPGCVARYWDYYCGWPHTEIVRCENLAEDCVRVITEAGEPVENINMFRARRDYVLGNHSNQTQHKIRSTPAARYEEFYQSHSEVFERYGYTRDYHWWFNRY